VASRLDPVSTDSAIRQAYRRFSAILS